MKNDIMKAIIACYAFQIAAVGLCPEGEEHTAALDMVGLDCEAFGVEYAVQVGGMLLINDATATWEVL